MKIKNLFIFLIIFSNNCFCQIKETIRVKEVFIPLKIYENDKVVKNDKVKKEYIYSYKLNTRKDSILYNEISDSSSSKIPIIFTLKKDKKGNNAIFSMTDNENLSNLNIMFLDKMKFITVNNDNYILNSLYYNELKKSIYDDNNILDLVDLLDDRLGDYPYQLDYLSKISSNKKYKNEKFKIISAKINTTRTQSGTLDTWSVSYNYNKSDILISIVKKSTEGEIGFEKKLLSHKGTEYKYKIYSNVESRFEDNNEVIFDVDKNTYSGMQSHFQIGIVKEEVSQLKRTFYKVIVN